MPLINQGTSLIFFCCVDVRGPVDHICLFSPFGPLLSELVTEMCKGTAKGKGWNLCSWRFVFGRKVLPIIHHLIVAAIIKTPASLPLLLFHWNFTINYILRVNKIWIQRVLLVAVKSLAVLLPSFLELQSSSFLKCLLSQAPSRRQKEIREKELCAEHV